MAGELIGGAALGTVFGEISKYILEVKDKAIAFPSIFQNIQDTLDALIPVFKKIEELNKQLDRQDESKEWIKRMEEGKELIKVCSKIHRRNYWDRYRYADKLKKFDESLDRLFRIMQVQEARDIIEVTKMMRDVHQHLIGDRMMVLGGCEVPAPPEFTVGLDKPITELKLQLLKSGVSVVVISAPEGYGKTTLVKKLCQEEAIKGKFKSNIFYVNVSRKANLRVIIQKLLKAKAQQVPDFGSDEEAINQVEHLLKQLQRHPILLVLDDVLLGSESIVEKFKFQLSDYKILVTSSSTFPRFDYTYHLNPLSDEDAMSLFRHSAFQENESNILSKQRLVNEMVKLCKRQPLALTVVGKSLRGQNIAIWQRRLKEGISVFSDSEMLSCLQSSLDFLELDTQKEGNLKDCFMDISLFPEDQRILVTALIDMWGELYKLDSVNAVANIQELCNRNLASVITVREDASELEGYYDKHFITQHGLLRELAVLLSSERAINHRERLYMEVNGNGDPICWIDKKRQFVSTNLLSQQPFSARLLSISTDQTFSSPWWKMQLPDLEVLLLSFEATHYTLPEFIENMDKLRVLIIANDNFFQGEIINFALIGSLSNLKRMRLKQISIPPLSMDILQMKNLETISLVLCNINQNFAKYNTGIPGMLPNIREINIDYCHDLVELPCALCDLVNLKRLSITNCHELSSLPKEIGKLNNLEVLRLQSCTKLSELPDSIANLHSLRFLDISNCTNLRKLPEKIDGLHNLRKIHMGGCWGIRELPLSIKALNNLEFVICDEDAVTLWEAFNLKGLVTEAYKEDINLNWLGC